MNYLTADFVSHLAQVWHHCTLPQTECEILAEMLVPMDKAAKKIADQVDFDMEPSEYELEMVALSTKSNS